MIAMINSQCLVSLIKWFPRHGTKTGRIQSFLKLWNKNECIPKKDDILIYLS